MSGQMLRFIIRTPRQVVLERDVSSLRVPTETGQVGLRPRAEPTVLAVEPGLIVLRMGEDFAYAGTAGGLLHCDGAQASLLTPLAVAGESLDDVQAELDKAMAAPDAEMEVRRTLSRLETSILQEVQRGEETRPSSRGD